MNLHGIGTIFAVIVRSYADTPARMQWQCPACGIEIHRHKRAPQSWRLYRCEVCRLDLQFDPVRDRMVLAAVDDPTAFAMSDLELDGDRRAPQLGPRRGGRRATDR
jgi:hypothetical protein